MSLCSDGNLDKYTGHFRLRGLYVRSTQRVINLVATSMQNHLLSSSFILNTILGESPLLLHNNGTNPLFIHCSRKNCGTQRVAKSVGICGKAFCYAVACLQHCKYACVFVNKKCAKNCQHSNENWYANRQAFVALFKATFSKWLFLITTHENSLGFEQQRKKLSQLLTVTDTAERYLYKNDIMLFLILGTWSTSCSIERFNSYGYFMGKREKYRDFFEKAPV